MDFDAQDDSFMAKHLVEAGTQDIPVGTPIFVTVDEADSVAAFKDFQAQAVVEEGEVEAASAPEPVVEEKVAAAAPAATPSPPPAAAPAPPAPAATAASVVEAPPAPVSSPGATVGLVFKRDWGSGVHGSPLTHR